MLIHKVYHTFLIDQNWDSLVESKANLV
jgi:hypothetical protein